MSKAADTRMLILQKAFELIYVNGYQATSIDDILATTQVTKGAFFYHFKNKEEMGLSMIREIMHGSMYDALTKPVINSNNPVKDIYELMKNMLFNTPFMTVQYGCPAINLIEEMSHINPKFNTELKKIMDAAKKAIEDSLTRGKKLGKINKAIQVKQVSNFIMTGYGGVRNLGKLYNDTDCYTTYLKELKRYLKSME